jgi:predicted phosphodiesterase
MSLSVPAKEELVRLLQQHRDRDSVARALGVPRRIVRGWFEEHEVPRLHLVGEEPSHEVEDNEIALVSWDFSHMDSLRLYALGDVHKGAASHQRERWREWIGFMEREDDAAMIGTGDFCNAAIVNSKSDIYEEQMNVGDAKRELREELAPIKDKILVLLPGNHDARISRAVGDCPVRDIADSLGCPYATSAVLLQIKVGSVDYQIYLRHGTGNGQSDAAMAKGASVFPFADVQIQGHTHKPKITVDDYFVVQDGRLQRRSRHNTVSGSFLGYERYAAERGYQPTRIGAPRIRLDGHVRDVKVSV